MAAAKNPLGAKSDKIWRAALLRAVRRRLEGKGHPQQLERMADKCVSKAVEGDMAACKEVGDRLDGRASQSVDIDITAAPTEIVRQIIEPGTDAAEVVRADHAASNGAASSEPRTAVSEVR